MEYLLIFDIFSVSYVYYGLLLLFLSLLLVEAEQKDKLIENEISKMDEALKKIMKQMQASGKKHSAATRNRANSADLSKATKEKEEEETSTPSGL